MLKREYNYNDVYLVPRKTVVETRKECRTHVTLGKHTFRMPVMPSNMKTVVSAETCEFLAEREWFYIMHRFDVDPVKFVYHMKYKGFISSISLGVNADTYKGLKDLKEAGLAPDYATLDIANAWCPKGESMIKFMKDFFPDTYLIAGNVATGDAAGELEVWGADCIKVGIAGGSVCTTKNKTGFHRPMVSTVMDCVDSTNKPIIADGGIIEHGDIAKALSLGAHMVMAGQMFAGYEESAGTIIETSEGHRKKEYFGSASGENKGEHKNVEGKRILIDYKGPMERLLKELEEDLQSSISYAGGRTVLDLMKAEMITIK